MRLSDWPCRRPLMPPRAKSRPCRRVNESNLRRAATGERRMRIRWNEAELAFRDEVRAFLDAELTPEMRRDARRMTSVYAPHDLSMAWQAILHARGWAAPAWPVEYGGCGWTAGQRYIFALSLIHISEPTRLLS